MTILGHKDFESMCDAKHVASAGVTATRRRGNVRFVVTMGVLLLVSTACGLGSVQEHPSPLAEIGDLEIREVIASGRIGPLDEHHDLDEPTLWINADQSAHSMIIATNKADGDLQLAGLHTYTLGGIPIQTLTGFYSNNVDLRSGFPLGDTSIDLVATADRSDGNYQLLFFMVDKDPESETYRLLLDISGSNLSLDFEPYGQALYHDVSADRWYVFVSRRNEPHRIVQFEITHGNGSDEGKVVFRDPEPVRVIEHRPSPEGNGTEDLAISEGMHVDEKNNALYVGEEDFGLLRYGARPSDGTVGTVVDTVVREGGRILEDVEGITIIETSETEGYIIAAGQNDYETSRFEVYDRLTNEYLHSFVIVPDPSDPTLPGAKATDGIYGFSGFVNDDYPRGAFIAHSDNGEDELPSLLIVRYEDLWPGS